jgi:hypothetical protein
MKVLLDVSANQKDSLGEDVLPLIGGQLLTPLTRYTRWSDTFAIDNGAFSTFRRNDFSALLERESKNIDKCLFVAVPDIVGDARRTLEVFLHHRQLLMSCKWPLAFVCQDGAENHVIPWDSLAAVFIGGTTEWKMSKYVVAIIKAAQILGKHVHVGRINTPARWNHFEKLGVDTCDGSGLCRFDWMLQKIASKDDHPLLEAASKTS